jgi:hypothetical protein
MTKVEETDAPLLYRQPLNLPAGSVRTSLVLLILLPFWLALALEPQAGPMPLYLYFLLGLVFVFFASHGASIAHIDDHPSPFWLPRGFFRLAVIAITIAVIAWRWYRDGPEQLADRLKPDPAKIQEQWAGLLFAVALGYTAGWGLSRLLGKWRDSPIFQDVQASVSLLAMFGLSIAAIIHLIINPQLQNPLDSSIFEYILTGVVAWYFGARS